MVVKKQGGSVGFDGDTLTFQGGREQDPIYPCSMSTLGNYSIQPHLFDGAYNDRHSWSCICMRYVYTV